MVAGLYGERVGALTVITKDPAVTKRVESQLKQTIRAMYSSPPGHGASIVTAVLSDPKLFQVEYRLTFICSVQAPRVLQMLTCGVAVQEWKRELEGMAGRIKTMRSKLHEALQQCNAPGSWDHVVNQIGMFSCVQPCQVLPCQGPRTWCGEATAGTIFHGCCAGSLA